MKLLSRFLPRANPMSVSKDLIVPGYSDAFVRYYRGLPAQAAKGDMLPTAHAVLKKASFQDKPLGNRLIGTILDSAPPDAYAFQLMRFQNLTGRFGASSQKTVPDNLLTWIGTVETDQLTGELILTTSMGDQILMRETDHVCSPEGTHAWPPSQPVAALSSAHPATPPVQSRAFGT